MLASVLRSDRAAHVNVEIMRAFVRLGRALTEHADLRSARTPAPGLTRTRKHRASLLA